MSLAKDDLKQFKGLLEENNKDFRKVVKDEITENNKEIRKAVREEIQAEVEKLATLVNKGFQALTDDNHKAHEQIIQNNHQEHAQIRKDISHLEFIATEMVRRDELLEVKQRLTKIEAKLGIAK